MTTSLDELHDIARMPAGRAREDAIGRFIAERMSLYSRIARPLCRRYGLHVETHLADVASLVSIIALTTVRTLVDEPAKLANLRNFEAFLHVSCADKVRAYAHSEVGRAPASGMSSMMRRRAALEGTRDEMRATLHRDPTNQETVDAYNAHVAQTRKNAAAQGALATTNDLIELPAMELDGRDVPQVESESVMHSTEGRELVKAMIEAADQAEDPLVGLVARAWVGDFYSTPAGVLPTTTEIAAELDIPERKVRRIISDVKLMAVDLLSERYGITEDLVA